MVVFLMLFLNFTEHAYFGKTIVEDTSHYLSLRPREAEGIFNLQGCSINEFPYRQTDDVR